MTGVTHMSRNRSMYRSRSAASKPGAMMLTVWGANTMSTSDAMPITPTAIVRIERPNARAVSAASARRPVNSGTNGATSPLATSTSRASSGRTNAAL